MSRTSQIMSQPKDPVGWDEDRVRRVLEHYETQSDEETVAEDGATYEATTHTAMVVPVELVPAVREMLASGVPDETPASIRPEPVAEYGEVREP